MTEPQPAGSVKELMARANAAVPKIAPDEARRLIAEGNALVVDVRDSAEIAASGRLRGAIAVSRGMIEFRADPAMPSHDKAFAKNRPVILYCASGGRSALAGKVLKDFGYAEVYNLGAFKDWAAAGGEVEPG
jgi:rhodanese-related sulfurtransferase